VQPELIRFLLIGFVAGWIASIAARGRILRLRGCMTYTIFGLVGALGGGYLFDMLGLSDVASVLAAAVGAMGSLVFLQMLRNA
jgi:uncharacterized membrane protein YeaQ/YmgE (transglycosylase-associated protein family)